MNRKYLTLTGVLLGSALLVLSACSSDEEYAPSPEFTEASSISVTTTAAPDVTDVDLASFEMEGRYVFDVPMGNDTTTLCIMGDGSVTCTGNAPEDVPDVEIAPFPAQSPGAVALDGDGLTWTMVEGIPPAPGKLEPSQRISDGDVSCETDESGSLDCSLGDNGFAINYEDAAISVRGAVQGTESAEAEFSETDEAEESDEPLSRPTASNGGVDGDYRSTDEEVGPETWCGVAEPDETEVYIDEGSVGCLTAQGVIDEYRERRDSEGGGNSLMMQVGEWNCSIPSAGRSQELSEEIFSGMTDVATVCDNPDGTRIVTAV